MTTTTNQPRLYVTYPGTPGGPRTGEPCATVADAWQKARAIAGRRVDLLGQDIRIELADGTCIGTADSPPRSGGK